MRGLITNRDVLANLPVVIAEFGPGCVWRWLRSMLRREHTTFLDVALKTGRS